MTSRFAGRLPTPFHATGEAHVRDNRESLSIDLDGVVVKVDTFDRKERRVDPDFGPWNR